MSNPNTTPESTTAEQEKVSFPSRYNVVMHNDDVTPMDFVIMVIVRVFKHSLQTAEKIMMDVHTNGKAVVGNYTKEMAEAKVEESLHMSRQNGIDNFNVTAEEE